MKTKTAVLNGKPDAGNPHVRFDEGEVASAKPRRGSLLYKQLMRLVVVFCSALCGLSAFADAADHLVHKWTFNDGTARDSVGSADGTLHGSATIEYGALVLPGSYMDFLKTSALGESLTNVTLIAWCSLADPNADAYCSGSPLSVTDGDVGTSQFDAIVFGERVRGQWMNGSDSWNRTPENNGGLNETSMRQVMIAVVIQIQPSYGVSIYRNGKLYAAHNNYARTGNERVLSADSCVLIGPRNHSGRTASNGYFHGAVDEARVYNAALTAKDISDIYNMGPEAAQSEDGIVVAGGFVDELNFSNNLIKIGLGTYQARQVRHADGLLDIRNGRVCIGDKMPVHRWSFNLGKAQDCIGAADAAPGGTYEIADGALHLEKPTTTGKNTNYLVTGCVGESISAVTLVTWCALADLQADKSCGGSPLSLTVNTGTGAFNAIVFGEGTAGQWMNGSDYWNRTVQNNNGAIETSTNSVMIAAVVHDRGATLYRNGSFYASHTTCKQFPTLPATAVALFGPRNNGDGYFNGSVDEARIYESPLTAEEVAAIAARGPDGANGEVDEALSNVVVRLGGDGAVFDLGLVPRLVKGITGAGGIQNGLPHVSENLCATGMLAFADGLALGEGAEIGVVGNESVIRVGGTLTLPAKATVAAVGLTNGTESVELMRSTLPVDWATLTKGWKFSTDARGRYAKPCWTETTLGLKLGKSGMVLLLK